MCAQSLKEIDEYMQDHKAYLGGDRPNAVDCTIAPRLYHIQVAMKEFKVHHPWPPLPYGPSSKMRAHVKQCWEGSVRSQT